jgi:flagellar motility protein MotE (MotC chaperone)
VANLNTERTTYSAFERFLYFFLIPFLYSSVLVTLLFIIFNQDVRKSVQEAANQIPIIKEIVPDVKEEPTGITSPEVLEVQREAQSQLQDMEQRVKTAIETARQKDDEIRELQEKIISLEEQLEEKRLSMEEYTQHIRSLSNMYAGMKVTRAAPIIESLQPAERVLILSHMSLDDRASLLERMNPQIAAETTMALKDMEKVEDVQVAALQERIEVLTAQLSEQSEALTAAELGATFATMDAASASAVLLEMMKTNETKVIAIVRAMNNEARSNILSAMTAADSSAAANLSSKLGG